MKRKPKDLTRNKWVYEEHKRGRTYVDMAKELGLSNARVWQIAKRWERELEMRARREAIT